MSNIINADNGVASGVPGLKYSADATGIIQFQNNGTNSFTLNTSLAVGVGSTPSFGTTGQVLTSNGTSAAPNWGSAIVSGTSVILTNQTTVDFTSLPSWIKRITVMFSGVSTNSTSTRRIQIGSGSTATTGYSCAYGYATTGTGSATSTSGFDIINGSAAEVMSGHMVLTNLSGNLWVSSTVVTALGGTAGLYYSAGSITLGGVLDRVRLTTANGTDTYDAGSVNILYE